MVPTAWHPALQVAGQIAAARRLGFAAVSWFVACVPMAVLAGGLLTTYAFN